MKFKTTGLIAIFVFLIVMFVHSPESTGTAMVESLPVTAQSETVRKSESAENFFIVRVSLKQSGKIL